MIKQFSLNFFFLAIISMSAYSHASNNKVPKHFNLEAGCKPNQREGKFITATIKSSQFRPIKIYTHLKSDA